MNYYHPSQTDAERIEADFKILSDKKFELIHGYHPNLSLLETRYNPRDSYPRIYAETKGNLCKVRKVSVSPTISDSERAKITGFTFKARTKLTETLVSIRWEDFQKEKIKEITLTYHNNFANNGVGVKKDLSVFEKRIQRRYPKSTVIWKLEFQKRGVPHYHLVLITKEVHENGDYWIYKDGELIPYSRKTKKILSVGTKGLRYWVQKNWTDIVDSEDFQHFNSGTEAEQVKKPNRMAMYLGKYMAKETKVNKKDYSHDVPEGFEDVGRWWGIYGRKHLKIKTRRYYVDEETYNQLIESIRKSWDKKELPQYKGMEWGLNYYAESGLDIGITIHEIILDYNIKQENKYKIE